MGQGWSTIGMTGSMINIHSLDYGGAPHAFFNDTRPDTYRPHEAREAWDRTLKFFAQHLQG